MWLNLENKKWKYRLFCIMTVFTSNCILFIHTNENYANRAWIKKTDISFPPHTVLKVLPGLFLI